MVNKGHVPYVNAYEQLPDEMNIKGKDVIIFRVEVSCWAKLDSCRTLSGLSDVFCLFSRACRPTVPFIGRQKLCFHSFNFLLFLQSLARLCCIPSRSVCGT